MSSDSYVFWALQFSCSQLRTDSGALKNQSFSLHSNRLSICDAIFRSILPSVSRRLFICFREEKNLKTSLTDTCEKNVTGGRRERDKHENGDGLESKVWQRWNRNWIAIFQSARIVKEDNIDGREWAIFNGHGEIYRGSIGVGRRKTSTLKPTDNRLRNNWPSRYILCHHGPSLSWRCERLSME